MLAAYLSVALGIIVAVVYVYLLIDNLVTAKRDMIAHGGVGIGEAKEIGDAIFEAQKTGLLLKSIASVILSILAVYLLGTSPTFWTLAPFLSIGTALAVIIAFLIDKRTARTS